MNVGSLLPDDRPQKKVILAYTKEYEERFKEPISSFGGHAWDSMNLAIAALKAVGPDPAKIRDYIEQTQNFVGCTVFSTFRPRTTTG